MKMSFQKHSPIERHYMDYKYFDWTKFKNNLNKKLSEGVSNYESFETTFIKVLNKHALLKKLRANHTPYIRKTLRKAIMCRSQLETKYLKSKIQTDLKLYKKYENFFSKLYKRERRKYYGSLDMKNVLVKKIGKQWDAPPPPRVSVPHKTLKYWVGVQLGQSYLMGRRCLFSLGWPLF